MFTTEDVRWRRWLDTAATIALTAMALLVMWRSAGSIRTQPGRTVADTAQVPTDPVSLGEHRKGSAAASAGMLIFSDFECPYCGSFARTTMPRLEKRYVDSGQLVIGFRHFPNEAAHPSALYASTAAVCAGRQGRFWALHDRLFLDRSPVSRRTVTGHVDALDLDYGAFDRCLKDGRTVVDNDLRTAIELRLTASPTVLIGRLVDGDRVAPSRLIVGAQRPEVFEAAVDSVLR